MESKTKKWRAYVHAALARMPRASDINLVIGVNSFFNNSVDYLDDLQAWGKNDFWSTPSELLENGKGDCEDFAIAKYFTLVEMGIPVDLLRIAYVRYKTSKLAHMVTLYLPSPCGRSGPISGPVILDNVNQYLCDFAEVPNLELIYSFNEKALWVGDDPEPVSTRPDKHLKHWADLKIRIEREKGLTCG